MNEPVFDPSTKRHFGQFLHRPSHAVIITGLEGTGKYTAGLWLGARLLGVQNPVSLENYRYCSIVRPDGQSISIQAMRDLAMFTKLKVPGRTGLIGRIVIIDQAQLLTAEAQNALLKLLEEPPADTVLILTAPSIQSLLPTIRSRAQHIRMQLPSGENLIGHFEAAGFSKTHINQAFLMSGGLPGLMHALLEQHDDHPLIKASQSAREVLKADTFARQCMVDGLSKQRPELDRLIFMVKQMSHAAIAQNAANQNAAGIGRWHKIHAAAYGAENALRASAQPKLVLTNFMLQI